MCVESHQGWVVCSYAFPPAIETHKVGVQPEEQVFSEVLQDDDAAGHGVLQITKKRILFTEVKSTRINPQIARRYYLVDNLFLASKQLRGPFDNGDASFADQQGNVPITMPMYANGRDERCQISSQLDHFPVQSYSWHFALSVSAKHRIPRLVPCCNYTVRWAGMQVRGYGFVFKRAGGNVSPVCT